MTDERLSGLCLLAVERDFKVDFSQVIDQFSIGHNNSKIMLRRTSVFLLFLLFLNKTRATDFHLIAFFNEKFHDVLLGFSRSNMIRGHEKHVSS
jgi:hypothetical protein